MNNNTTQKKSLAETHPNIAKEWHPTKNGNLKPTNVTSGSGKKVWWICENKHVWAARISSRVGGAGCPICMNREVLIGYNDLATTHPEIAKEWHPTKNGELKPTDVVAGKKRAVWWVCDKGHEYKAMVCRRTKGNGCPICAGKEVLIGYNDLATTHPELAKEWHPTKNGELKPTDVTAGSGKKVWWQCENGHEWRAVIASRKIGRGCSYCSHHGTSRQEIILLYYIRKFSDVDVKHRAIIDKTEIDIFFCRNNIKIGIEYDGVYTHKDKKEQDIKKNKKCEKMGIKLYRIRENPLFPLNSTSVDLFCNAYRNDEYSKLIEKLIFDFFGVKTSINIEQDRFSIDAFFKLVEIEESFATRYPELAKEWHPTKNGKLKPEHVSHHSLNKVWWVCDRGHEYEAPVTQRSKGCGCPICAGKKVLIGYNDIATTHPMLAKEWHPTKNGNLKPVGVTAGSNKKVWWKCKDGHEYEATIGSRASGAGCPYCSNQKVLIGFNDIATTHPDLAKQWHPTKNGDLRPTDVVAGSHKEVYWRCEHGHTWKATVIQRSSGTKCPICANRRILIGFNDLATTHPEIAKQWHPTKNGGLKPTDVTAGSDKEIWWQCEHGHEWQAKVSKRKPGYGCPYCSNHRILVGFNDLATKYPEIAKEWHPTKNGDLKPTDVLAGSRRKVWWVNDKRGEWETSVYSRTQMLNNTSSKHKIKQNP